MKSPRAAGISGAAVMLVLTLLATAMLDAASATADEKTVTLTVKDKATELRLTKGDTFELKLQMQGGTGYTWQVAKDDQKILKSKGEPTTEAMGDAKPGGPQLRVFRFQAVAGGTCELELHYRRPFEKDKPPEKTYKLTIQVGDAK
jgi:inhibitor of cysteine peptidase